MKPSVRDLVTVRVGGDTPQVLMVPSTPGPGPVLDMDPAALDEFRGRALSLTAIAGLGKLPQVSHKARAIVCDPVCVCVCVRSGHLTQTTSSGPPTTAVPTTAPSLFGG